MPPQPGSSKVRMMAEGEVDKVCIRIYLHYLYYTYILVVIAGVVRFGLDMYLSLIDEYLSCADMQPYIHRPGRS